MTDKEKTAEETKTVDASGLTLGRVATDVARLLRGKDSVTFERHRVSGSCVSVINIAGMNIPPKKLKDKTYIRYSGYPGGQKEQTLEKLIKRHGRSEVLRRAVYGMLPDNKLRKPLMKRLTISE